LDDPFRVDAKTRFVGQERHDDLAEEADGVLIEVRGERLVEPRFDLGLLEELVKDGKGLDPTAIATFRPACWIPRYTRLKHIHLCNFQP